MMTVVEMSACVISDRPASIPHNLPTIPRASRGVWFLSGASTAHEFIFIHSTRLAKVVKTAADGWTKDDALTFASALNEIQ
jgi:hypothetical protein